MVLFAQILIPGAGLAKQLTPGVVVRVSPEAHGDIQARTLPGAAVTRFLSFSSDRCQIEFLKKLKLMLYLEGVGSLS